MHQMNGDGWFVIILVIFLILLSASLLIIILSSVSLLTIKMVLVCGKAHRDTAIYNDAIKNDCKTKGSGERTKSVTITGSYETEASEIIIGATCTETTILTANERDLDISRQLASERANNHTINFDTSNTEFPMSSALHQFLQDEE